MNEPCVALRSAGVVPGVNIDSQSSTKKDILSSIYQPKGSIVKMSTSQASVPLDYVFIHTVLIFT